MLLYLRFQFLSLFNVFSLLYIKALKLRQNVEIFKTTDLNDLVTLKNVSGLILSIMRFYSPYLLKTKPQLCFLLENSVL